MPAHGINSNKNLACNEQRCKSTDSPLEKLIEATSEALQKEYRKEFGKPLMYGAFKWIYHDGKLHSIEDHPRNRRYRSIYAK